MENKENEKIEQTKDKVSTPAEDLLNDVIKDEKSTKDTKKSDKKNKKPVSADKVVKKSSHSKKFRHGAMATVLTCVFLAVLVLVNVVCTMLFDRFPITIDLTSQKIYSISDESEEYAKNVSVDVLVTVFADEQTYTNYNSYNKTAVELLKRYSQMNSHITYRFVDIDSNPEIAADYTDVSQFDIVFETKTTVDGKESKRTRKLGMLDLLTFNDEFLESLSNSGYSIDMLAQQAGSDLAVLQYYGSYVTSSNAEQAFTSALMTVTDPNPVYVTFLTGREEISQLSYLQSLLTANGYNVDSVDITSQDIPAQTDVVVIPAPKTDYLEAEITKISDFMNNDGNLGKQMIYCANVAQSATPNLDEFLQEYGIEIGDGVICETYSGNYYNQPYWTVASDLSDSFNQDLETADPKILVAQSRPVNVLFEESGMVGTEEYIKSTADAYTADVTALANGETKTLVKGQQCYMAVGSKANFVDNSDTEYSNVIALGTSNLLEDQFLGYDQYQNREYFLSVLNGITHKTDGVTITPKVITGNIFDITEAQKTVLIVIFCVAIPLIVLVTGVVIWIRRIHR